MVRNWSISPATASTYSWRVCTSGAKYVSATCLHRRLAVGGRHTRRELDHHDDVERLRGVRVPRGVGDDVVAGELGRRVERADRELLGRVVGGVRAGDGVAELPVPVLRFLLRDRDLVRASAPRSIRAVTSRSSSGANDDGLDDGHVTRLRRRASSCRCRARTRSSTSRQRADVGRELGAHARAAEVVGVDDEVATELLAHRVVDRDLHRRGEHGEQRRPRRCRPSAPTRSTTCAAGSASRSGGRACPSCGAASGSGAPSAAAAGRATTGPNTTKPEDREERTEPGDADAGAAGRADDHERDTACTRTAHRTRGAPSKRRCDRARSRAARRSAAHATRGSPARRSRRA